MMMKPPRPRSAIPGRKWCAKANGAQQFSSSARRDSSGLRSRNRPIGE
jgi:hypothetical protein